MKKKILFVLPGFTFGGTVFSTLNMISFLKKDYDITVLAMTHQGPVKEYYERAGIKILPEDVTLSALIGVSSKETSFLRKAAFFTIKSIRRVCKYLNIDYPLHVYHMKANRIQRNGGYDFVASCQELASTYLASCFDGPKKLAWFRSEMSILKTEISEKEFNKARANYLKFDNIVCVSQTTCDDFKKNIPEVANNLFAIHNIQNTNDIEFKADQAIDDFPKSPFVMVSVGRMNPQKRFSSIPHIARQLKDLGCKFQWLIIGDGNAFGEYDKIMDSIESEGVSDCVKCIGSRLNPYPYIKQAQLLVNTSYVEACPRVVAEAKILKTPCVCADFSSAREFVTSGFDGFVDTIDDLVNPLSELILNENTYKKIKSNCEAYLINNCEIYEKLKYIFS